MITGLRRAFNARFDPARHVSLLTELEKRCGAPVAFRVSETPVFIPRALLSEMEDAGTWIITRLVNDRAYLRRSAEAVPEQFRAAGDEGRPLFIAVDFGIARGPGGKLIPRLIELQGFPSLFCYQPIVARLYGEIHNLPPHLTPFAGGVTRTEYTGLLRQAILGGQDPAEVVLMEIDPERQKTRPDFTATEQLCGISTVNIRDLVRQGKKLYRSANGRLVPIRRLYNRVIADEVMRLQAPLPFHFGEELDVEWTGHPNWFFHLSKFSMPFLEHPSVPRTMFLSDLSSPPEDPERWVLKPLFSFAGLGVIVGPTREQIASVPAEKRASYVLQERVEYQGVVETPCGPTKAEVRLMYIWLDRLRPVLTLVRMGRGMQMGVDHNKGMEWVGASAGLSGGEEWE